MLTIEKTAPEGSKKDIADLVDTTPFYLKSSGNKSIHMKIGEVGLDYKSRVVNLETGIIYSLDHGTLVMPVSATLTVGEYNYD